jgi:hypothetical protein
MLIWIGIPSFYSSRKIAIKFMKIQITWIRSLNYESSRDFTGVIYLHEWHGKPFYWGKAERSHFGGSSRNNRKGEKVAARYNPGYRHWIEGCLQNGGKLYFGQIEAKHSKHLGEVEKYLITCFPTDNNKRKSNVNDIAFRIEHHGDIPECIMQC